MLQEGAAMQVKGLIDDGAIDLRAVQGLEGDAVFGDPPPFTPGFLALVRREGLEVLLEILVLVVPPVELHVASRQPAGRFEGFTIRFAYEQRMHRREVTSLCERADRIDQMGA
jgi:hypothetical protein